MTSIDRVNEGGSKWMMTAWLVGLAWFWFRSPEASLIVWWEWLILIMVGVFAASAFIGGALALIMALLTRLFYGHAYASPNLYGWGAFIGIVLAFLAAAPAARWFA